LAVVAIVNLSTAGPRGQEQFGEQREQLTASIQDCLKSIDGRLA
jgi:hypothetical protein